MHLLDVGMCGLIEEYRKMVGKMSPIVFLVTTPMWRHRKGKEIALQMDHQARAL